MLLPLGYRHCFIVFCGTSLHLDVIKKEEGNLIINFVGSCLVGGATIPPPFDRISDPSYVRTVSRGYRDHNEQERCIVIIYTSKYLFHRQIGVYICNRIKKINPQVQRNTTAITPFPTTFPFLQPSFQY